MLKKPPQCHGCPLCSVSTGYAPPVGPDSSDLLFLGESLGREEALKGELFTGGAGATLNRGFHFTKLNRPLIKLASLVSCSPPGFDLKSRETSVDHCRRAYLNPTIERWLAAGDPARKVLIALGGHALRNVLGLRDAPNIKVQDFHGTVSRDPTDRFWVVPTFSPKFIQQGAYNLLGTFYWDIEVAKDVAANGNPPDPAELVMDPPVEWFAAWVDNHIASMKLDGALDPNTGTLLAADIETPEKTRKGDEGELTHKDRDYNIIRINFANHTDEGLTVPWHGPYLAHIKRLLESPGVKLFHNKNYDVPRLLHAGVKVRGPIFDTMEMWHKLQSDVPRGLGFVAPFYSRYGAWKHLSSTDPVRYAAIDPLQTIRIGYECRDELIAKGLWETPFIRHTYLLDTHALNPASEVGFDVDKEALFAADDRLDEIIFETDEKIQKIVPDSLRPLDPKNGLTAPPKAEKADKYGRLVPVIEQSGEHLVRWCSGCQEVVKTAKHKKREDGTPCPAPSTELKAVVVKRWFRVMPFNVGSRDHLFAYMALRKHQPGRDKKTKKPTANKDTLKKLAAKTKDPLYILALRRKQCDKISSTYIKGTVKRLATNPRSMADGRLHPTTTHKPSTQRTSQQDPNLQNVVARGADEELASLFRRCLIARGDSILVEADFSGIEAVETGYFAGDPAYIRLAKLGVHAYLASHLLARDRRIDHPADLGWSDADLLLFFKDLKEKFIGYYDLAKRCVHGSNYAMTPKGMALQFPELFPNERAAALAQGIYFEIAPSFPKWQLSIKERANRQGYLGGKDHPFRYLHYFFNVASLRAAKGIVRAGGMVKRGGTTYITTWGEDAKRACAFYPQSTAAGVIKESMLRLFTPGAPNYIGDRWFGRTPLRALVHDSLVLELDRRTWEDDLRKVITEMVRPIAQQPLDPAWGMGTHLSIGVEVKCGQNWAPYHKEQNPTGMQKYKLPADLMEHASELAADIVVPMDYYDDELDSEEMMGELEEAGA